MDVKLLHRLSIELSRTQMINKALVELLEEKGILTEAEVLIQLDKIINEVIKETMDKIDHSPEPSFKEKKAKIFDFKPKGEA
jgi:hypothetical protein